MNNFYFSGTADFIKKGTFSVHSFNGDYLSIPRGLRAEGTFFMKFPVPAFHIRPLGDRSKI